MSLRDICSNTSIIDYNNILGSGTHGIVYGSNISSNIAVKVFPTSIMNLPTCYGKSQLISSCDVIRNGEYSYQEIAREYLHNAIPYLDSDIKTIIDIPEVYGFKFLPNAAEAKCCSYLMKRLMPLSNTTAIQLTFNYERDHDTILPSGRYVGIDTLKSFGLTNTDISKINRAIASIFAVLHYGMKTDAYDIEFVLVQPITPEESYGVYAIDFDKFSIYKETYPYCISRKLTETNYDHRQINNENHMIRLLATTIGYCPAITYPEYSEWKETYIKIAGLYGHSELATKVLMVYESMNI